MRALISLLVLALAGCHKAPRDASHANEVTVPPVAMKCGAYKLSVPGGGARSYDDEGNVIVEWSDRKARLQLPSDAPATPTEKDPEERDALEKLIEKKLRAQGCDFKKDVRTDATWYTCDMFAKNGRARMLITASEGDMCLAICASLNDDPKASATCDAIAPT